MDKLLYLAKTLSRTTRKDYENYVVNAVWQRLDNGGLKPVSQQWIARSDGTGYFIDLYFPQVNIGVECDEAYHVAQFEKDRRRELDLMDILRGIDAEHGYRALHVDVSKGYEETQRQIGEVVEAIWDEVDARVDAGTFEPWNPEADARAACAAKGCIEVGDDVGFSTIREACNTLFGTRYASDLRLVLFEPRGEFFARFGGKHKVWFPQKADSQEKVGAGGWTNVVSSDGKRILEFHEGIDKKPGHEPWQRVVFVKVKDPITGRREYRFVGVFELRGFTSLDGRVCREYVRVGTSFPVRGDGLPDEPCERIEAAAAVVQTEGSSECV